ncbi:hypothetical protein [Sanguibacter sp. 25GB23B1]|uniref:hypothetical protein n=1 Tax=unclassified Sanguibacter TaxID=2645534 RepID=UPI0032AEACB7
MTPLSRRPAGPTTHIHTGPTIPAWTLHAALAVAIVGAVCSAAAGTSLETSSLVVLVLGLLAAVGHAAWRPSTIPAVAALAATGLACIVVTPTSEGWRVPVIILCVHALVRLSWFTASSRPGGRIEVEVLRHEGRTFLVLGLAGQAVGLLAVVLTALEADGALGRSGALGIAGAVALLGLAALLLLPRSRTA